MAFVEQKTFKYPAEEECLVRRLGVGLMRIWPELPPDLKQKVLAEAHTGWDREFHVSHLDDKLEAILKRYGTRMRS
jgi:hypothetical protein